MTESVIPAQRRASPGLAMNITLWVLQILLAALFAFAGVNKIFGLMQEMVDNFARLGVGVWFRYLIGVFELAGAIGLLIPRLNGPAALGLATIMAGAVVVHLLVMPPVEAAIGTAVLCLVLLTIAWNRWPRTKTRSDDLTV